MNEKGEIDQRVVIRICMEKLLPGWTIDQQVKREHHHLEFKVDSFHVHRILEGIRPILVKNNTCTFLIGL
jgi:hypothetical protein